MQPLQKIIFSITIVILCFSDIEAIECIAVNKPITRIFESLTKYQSNKLSFNMAVPGCKGNYVEFNFTSIDRIPKNSFVTYESNYIIKLSLNNKGIQYIEGGAFLGLFCLHILELRQNNITHLSKSMFMGLENLRELDLNGNQLDDIPDVIFSNLKKLRVLNLSNNKIKKLHIFSFQNLTALETLDLGNNKLRNFAPDVTLPLYNLKEFILESNLLIDIEPEKWHGLGSLQSLNLANNSLLKFDPRFNFSFTNISKLDLSNNQLTVLYIYPLRKNFPNLKYIEIKGNPWQCGELHSILHELADSRIVYIGDNGTIGCSDTPYVPTTQINTTEKQPTTTLAPSNTTQPASHLMEDILKQNDKVVKSNEELLRNVRNVESLIVYLFVVVIIFAVLDISVRSGFCRRLYGTLTGSSHSYLDNSDSENFILLRR